jgi:hypothetical protein
MQLLDDGSKSIKNPGHHLPVANTETIGISMTSGVTIPPMHLKVSGGFYLCHAKTLCARIKSVNAQRVRNLILKVV